MLIFLKKCFAHFHLPKASKEVTVAERITSLINLLNSILKLKYIKVLDFINLKDKTLKDWPIDRIIDADTLCILADKDLIQRSN